MSKRKEQTALAMLDVDASHKHEAALVSRQYTNVCANCGGRAMLVHAPFGVASFELCEDCTEHRKPWKPELTALETESAALFAAAYPKTTAAARATAEPVATGARLVESAPLALRSRQPKLTHTEIDRCARCHKTIASWIWRVGGGQPDMPLCSSCVAKPRATYPDAVFTEEEYFEAAILVYLRCSACGGSGKTTDDTNCLVCVGRGRVRNEVAAKPVIPARAAAAPVVDKLAEFMASLSPLEAQWAREIVADAASPKGWQWWVYADIERARAKEIIFTLGTLTGLTFNWGDESQKFSLHGLSVRPTEATRTSTRCYIRSLDKNITYAWAYYNHLVAGSAAPDWSAGPKEMLGYRIEAELLGPYQHSENGVQTSATLDYRANWQKPAYAINIASELQSHRQVKKMTKDKINTALAEAKAEYTAELEASNEAESEQDEMPARFDTEAVLHAAYLRGEVDAHGNALVDDGATIADADHAAALYATPNEEDDEDEEFADVVAEMADALQASLREYWQEAGYIDASADVIVVVDEATDLVTLTANIHGAAYSFAVTPEMKVVSQGADALLLDTLTGHVCIFLYENRYGEYEPQPVLSVDPAVALQRRIGEALADALQKKLNGLNGRIALVAASADEIVLRAYVKDVAYNVSCGDGVVTVKGGDYIDPIVADTINSWTRKLRGLLPAELPAAAVPVEQPVGDTPVEQAIAVAPIAPEGLSPSDLAPYKQYIGQVSNDPDGRQWALFLAAQTPAVLDYIHMVVLDLAAGKQWEPWLPMTMDEVTAKGVVRVIGELLPFQTWWVTDKADHRYSVRSTETSRLAARLYLESLSDDNARKYGLESYNRYCSNGYQPSYKSFNEKKPGYDAVATQVLNMLYGETHRRYGVPHVERLPVVTLADLKRKVAKPKGKTGRARKPEAPVSIAYNAWIALAARLRDDVDNEALRRETRAQLAEYRALAGLAPLAVDGVVVGRSEPPPTSVAPADALSEPETEPDDEPLFADDEEEGGEDAE